MLRFHPNQPLLQYVFFHFFPKTVRVFSAVFGRSCSNSQASVTSRMSNSMAPNQAFNSLSARISLNSSWSCCQQRSCLGGEMSAGCFRMIYRLFEQIDVQQMWWNMMRIWQYCPTFLGVNAGYGSSVAKMKFVCSLFFVICHITPPENGQVFAVW